MSNGQYDRVSFHGALITRRQRQALRAVEEALDITFTVPQGSWRPATTYSGTTHTNAGVCDLYHPRISDPLFNDHVTRALRRLGKQAAFPRGPWVDMSYHWHVCDIDTTRMDPNAVWQVTQYRAPGGPYDGLVYLRRDHNHFRPSTITKWDYKA